MFFLSIILAISMLGTVVNAIEATEMENKSLNSLSPTTPKAWNIDKNRQKWYNRSAMKKTKSWKKACTWGEAYV